MDIKKSIQVIIILFILIALFFFLNKFFLKNQNKSNVDKKEKFNDSENNQFYLNNVPSHMRTASENNTDQNYENGMINNEIGFELDEYTDGDDTKNNFYQLSFDKLTNVYGIKIQNSSVGSTISTLGVKYSISSGTDDNAFMNVDTYPTNFTVQDEIQDIPFDKSYLVKHIRLYNNVSGSNKKNLRVDLLLKPLQYFSIKSIKFSDINTDDIDSEKDITISEEGNYISYIEKDIPLKPYSDKLGKKEIFNVKFQNDTINFEELTLGVLNKNQFDATLLRSYNDAPNLNCYLNENDHKIYCDTTIKTPKNNLRFIMGVVSGNINIDDTKQKIMTIQNLKTGFYANSNFEFVENSIIKASKFIITKHEIPEIKEILNISDYVNKIENDNTQDYKDCQGDNIYYFNLRRCFNAATSKKEHSNAIINREGKLPKNIEYGNGIHFDTNENKFTFNEEQPTCGYDDGNMCAYLDNTLFINYTEHTSSTLDNGPLCPQTEKGNYSLIYESISIGNETNNTNKIIFNTDKDTYKPELYEGKQIDNKYISKLKYHRPRSLDDYTPEVIKICVTPEIKDSLDKNKNFTLKTNIFNIIDDSGNTIEQEFTIDNDVIKDSTCSDSSLVNKLYKIHKVEDGSGDNLGTFELVSPTDSKYEDIDCGCNCLQSKQHIKDYRKQNAFVKGVLNNLITRTDNILSKRNNEITEIESDENSILDQPFIQDYLNYEKTNLLDTNKFVITDELRNYYKKKGIEGFEETPDYLLSVDLSSLKNEFMGVYKIFNGQFLLLEDIKIQIDENYIGFIKFDVPILKFKYDNVLPFYSPFQEFEGIKFRIITKDKMVHSVETSNIDSLLTKIGLKTPNFIYVSKHTRITQQENVDIYYKLSNREYTTLFQMKKI